MGTTIALSVRVLGRAPIEAKANGPNTRYSAQENLSPTFSILGTVARAGGNKRSSP